MTESLDLQSRRIGKRNLKEVISDTEKVGKKDSPHRKQKLEVMYRTFLGSLINELHTTVTIHILTIIIVSFDSRS